MRRPKLEAPYLLFMLLVSLFSFLTLAIASFGAVSPEARRVLDFADAATCLLFFVDFLLTFAAADDRLGYLRTWGWLDLLSCIPPIEILRAGRAARVLRIVRVLRGIKATRILGGLILERRAQSGILAAALVSMLLVVFAAAAVLQFETAPEATIRTAEDALWWAAVTITTVGYGDRIPLSSEGRALAVLLMFSGIGLFGTFSGFVASWLVGRPRGPESMSESLAALSAEIAALRAEVGRIRPEAPAAESPPARPEGPTG